MYKYGACLSLTGNSADRTNMAAHTEQPELLPVVTSGDYYRYCKHTLSQLFHSEVEKNTIDYRKCNIVFYELLSLFDATHGHEVEDNL